MFIANAIIQRENEIRIKICSEETEENEEDWRKKSSVIIVHYKRPIADRIMFTIANDSLPAKFECNRVKYILHQYSPCNFEADYNPYYIQRIRRIVKPRTTTYIYKDRCRCTRCFSDYGFNCIETVIMVVPLVYSNKYIEIEAQQCLNCGCYFIDQQSWDIYKSKYGMISLDTFIQPPFERPTNDNIQFKKDSILSRNGYTTKMMTFEREQLLGNMIDSGLNKAEIKDQLTRLIYYRSKSCPYAAVSWTHDLEFVNNYTKKKHR